MAAPAKSIWAKIYGAFEVVMPWKYTGVYSHPEFRSQVPDAVTWRPRAPTNPAFRAIFSRLEYIGPVVPVLENDKILDPKNFREATKRSLLLADTDISAERVAGMSQWQEKTPLGGRRFRWAKSREYIFDYEDNGYR